MEDEECPACGGEMKYSFALDWWRCSECAFTLNGEVMDELRPSKAEVIVEVTVERGLVDAI